MAGARTVSFYDYMEDIGVPLANIQRMRDDKIDEKIIPHLTDEDLSPYLDHHVHRMLARRFCATEKEDHDIPHAKRRQDLIEKFRQKNLQLAGLNRKPCIRKKSKPDRPIEFGLSLYDEHSGIYSQVRKASGGGTRNLRCLKTCKKGELMEIARNLYKIDPTNNILEMSTDVYGQNLLSANDTVESIHDNLKMNNVRFYLLCKGRGDPETDTIVDSLPPDELPDLYPVFSENSVMTTPCCDTPSPITTPSACLSTPSPVPGVSLSTANIVPSASLTTHSATLDHFHDASVPSTDTGPIVCLPSSSGLPSACLSSSQNDVLTVCLSHTGIAPFENDAEVFAPSTSPLHLFENMGTPTVSKKVESSERPTGIIEALTQLASSAEINETDEKNRINVVRENVLEGAIRAFGRNNFKMNNKLDVKFVGEMGIDNGGPTRDMMRLVMKELSQKFFIGEEDKFLKLDAVALSRDQYEICGKIISYCIVHGGPLPNFMSAEMFRIISEGLSVTDSLPLHDELLDRQLREDLNKVISSTEESFFESVEPVIQLIEVAGCERLMLFSKRVKLVSYIKRYMQYGRVKECLTQLLRGLESLGVLEMVRFVPTVMKEAFCAQNDCPLSADVMSDIFVPKWSQDGSNRKAAEKRIVSYWLDFLQDAEATGELPRLLVFATGADRVPLLGFFPPTSLAFRHPLDYSEDDPTIEFPKANTCTNEMGLPISPDYETFSERMRAAINIELFTTE